MVTNVIFESSDKVKRLGSAGAHVEAHFYL